MTNAERMINHIQLRLAQKSYTVLNLELNMFDKMLKALPSYEEDKVYDIICADDEAPDIEDPAMYRTFDSSEFHVGDEVVDDCGYRGVVVGTEKGFYVVMKDGSTAEWDESNDGWKRTGRNFPAIENILNILKKTEVNNAE